MKIRDLVRNRYAIVPQDPYFGIEVELENVPYPPRSVEDGESRWRSEYDGSLRNNGMEFLSRTPFTKDELDENISELYEYKSAYSYRSSVRTSTHVHVNVLDKTPQEIAAACAVYVLLEPLLFRYCGPVREENIYCVPWYRATNEVFYLKALSQNITSAVTESCKYSALYLGPIVTFGTLEFRQAPVFDEPKQLLDWCEICERIVYSGFKNIEQVLATYDAVPEDKFVRLILGDRLTGVLRDTYSGEIEELLEMYDVRTTVDLALDCTYKPTEWFTPSFDVEGDGADGYGGLSPTGRSYLDSMRTLEFDLMSRPIVSNRSSPAARIRLREAPDMEIWDSDIELDIYDDDSLEEEL